MRKSSFGQMEVYTVWPWRVKDYYYHLRISFLGSEGYFRPKKWGEGWRKEGDITMPYMTPETGVNSGSVSLVEVINKTSTKK